MGNANASEDARRYRERYPGKPEEPKATKNLEFYSNQRASKPDGMINSMNANYFSKMNLIKMY